MKGFSEVFRPCLAVWFVLASTLFPGVAANAQVTGATLSGTVTDTSGAVIPGVTISIKNRATGVGRTVMADEAGLYSAPNLQAGGYDVTATQPGFSTVVQSNITLTVGAQQQLNITMKVGETAQVVEVTEAAPLVQLSTSTISAAIDSKQILDIPLNGRDWASLATLSPGVTGLNQEVQLPFESGALRGNRGFGAQLSISGGRPTQNNYRLDGLSISDYTNGSGSVAGVTLGVDAIQEFSVITGNYSAEYGRTSGGVINAISKSGTNAFHGDVYEFLRNDKLDANDFFSNRAHAPRPTLRRNQYGAAGGGPIRKDRTFIFGDYEAIRFAEGIASGNSAVPSENARLGILAGQPVLTGPCANPATQRNLAPGRATTCVDNTIAAKYLGVYPHANGPVNPSNPDVANFVFAPTLVVNENFFTTRLDHKMSDTNSLFGTYNYDNSPLTRSDGFNAISNYSNVKRNIVALEWNHVFSPALVNTARLGYNRNFTTNNLTTGAILPAYGDPSLSMLPGWDTPGIRVSNLSNTSAGLPGGFNYFRWNSYQFYDDAFLTRGTHSLKFGFAGENMRYNPWSLYQPAGLLRFIAKPNPNSGDPCSPAIQCFLLNHPNSLEAGLPPTFSRGYRSTLLGGYIQDDWKVRHNLTLNVGLRYEMNTVISERTGRLTSLRNITDPLPTCGTSAPSATDTVLGKPGCAGVAPIFSNPTLRNFEPRFGFAWDPSGSGKTAVRGGFAIFDVLPLPGYFSSQAWAPFFLTGTVVDSPASPLSGTLGILPTNPDGTVNPKSAFSYYFGQQSQAGCTSPLRTCKLTASFTEPNPKRNYVEQWNINVQREIAPNLTVTVGYVGSHGLHQLIRGDDFDQVIPTHTSAGWLWPYNPTGKDMRINPNFGLIRGLSWGTSSSYEALQLNVQKRMSRGFQFGGSYTYGKSMDNDSATLLGDAFSNSITTWFWSAPSISWGPSDYNITHTASINGIWDMPGLKSLHGPAGALVNGWELASIVKLNSGTLTTPLISGDPMGVQNNGSDTFGIPDHVPGCDPVNHNFKSDPNLVYINTNCYKVPMAPSDPAIASQCLPFARVAGSCANLLGNAGRNSIVGPGLFNLDFSAYKNFAVPKISESFKVQFRAEFFNVLNHPNFQTPYSFQGAHSAQILTETGLPSGGGYLANPTVTKPREGQFALKVIW